MDTIRKWERDTRVYINNLITELQYNTSTCAFSNKDYVLDYVKDYRVKNNQKCPIIMLMPLVKDHPYNRPETIWKRHDYVLTMLNRNLKEPETPLVVLVLNEMIDSYLETAINNNRDLYYVITRIPLINKLLTEDEGELWARYP